MIKIISHRGNINGKDKNNENNPTHIKKVLKMGYDIEIDVWKIKDKFYLGHDAPQYFVEINFLKNDKLWCHAKNVEALEGMLKNEINCFWHQEDDYTITSGGLIWTYPGKILTEKSIIVLKEDNEYGLQDLKNVYGICTDNIYKLKNKLGI